MSRRAAIVELALSILHDAANSPGPGAQCVAVRLALYVLAGRASKHDLATFWTVCDNPNPSQRMHNLRALYGVIEAQARRSLASP